MPNKLATDFRTKTPDELQTQYELSKEQNFVSKKANGQLENTARVRKVRRDIARTKSIISEKKVRQQNSNLHFYGSKQMPKRELQGIVVSDKGDKTVIVMGTPNNAPCFIKIIKRSKSSQPTMKQIVVRRAKQ